MIPRNVSKVLMIRLDRGDDILETITALARTQGIRAAWIQGIGACDNAMLGYYDEAVSSYRCHKYDHFMEVLSLQGNVSIKDNEPFIHLHASCADSEGLAHGGHVLPGCHVFAMELTVWMLDGDDPIRELDSKTGLMLWPLPQRMTR